MDWTLCLVQMLTQGGSLWGRMLLCWYWILLDECLDFLSMVACFLFSFQKEAGRVICSTLQRNSFIWKRFVVGSWAVSWGSVTLLNGFLVKKEGQRFLASAVACQTVINAIEQWTGGKWTWIAQKGMRWTQGGDGDLQVIITDCVLFVDFLAVSRCNEVKWAKHAVTERERETMLTMTETKSKWTTRRRRIVSQSIHLYALSLSLSLWSFCMLVCFISLKGKVTFRCLMGYFNKRDLQHRERVPFVVRLCNSMQKV